MRHSFPSIFQIGMILRFPRRRSDDSRLPRTVPARTVGIRLRGPKEFQSGPMR